MYFRNIKIDKIFFLDMDNNDEPQSMLNDESFYCLPQNPSAMSADSLKHIVRTVVWLFKRGGQPARMQPYMKLKDHELLFPLLDFYEELHDTLSEVSPPPSLSDMVWSPRTDSYVLVVFEHPRTQQRQHVSVSTLVDGGPPIDTESDLDYHYVGVEVLTESPTNPVTRK